MEKITVAVCYNWMPSTVRAARRGKGSEENGCFRGIAVGGAKL